MTSRSSRKQGAEHARNHLPSLLDDAVLGRTTVITRHGQPVAALVPMALVAARRRQSSLLAIAGTGQGLWGKNSGQFLAALRDEWNR